MTAIGKTIQQMQTIKRRNSDRVAMYVLNVLYVVVILNTFVYII